MSELTHVVTVALSRDTAAEVTEAIRVAMARALEVAAELRGLVARAWDGQAWRALGYETWAAYCEEEFSPVQVRWTIDSRRALVVALLEDEHMSMNAIAPVLGVNEWTVRQDVRALSTSGSPEVDSGPDRLVGADGKERPRSRARSGEVLERMVTVAEKRGGARPEMTQQEVANLLGVSQPTVASYEAQLRGAGVLKSLDDPAAAERLDALAAQEVALTVETLAAAMGVNVAGAPEMSSEEYLRHVGRTWKAEFAPLIAAAQDSLFFSETAGRHPEVSAEVYAALAGVVKEAITVLVQAAVVRSPERRCPLLTGDGTCAGAPGRKVVVEITSRSGR